MPTPPPATPPEVSIFLEYHAAFSIFLGLVICVLICCVVICCRMYGKKRTLPGAPALSESLMGRRLPYTEVSTIRIDQAPKDVSSPLKPPPGRGYIRTASGYIYNQVLSPPKDLAASPDSKLAAAETARAAAEAEAQARAAAAARMVAEAEERARARLAAEAEDRARVAAAEAKAWPKGQRPTVSSLLENKAQTAELVRNRFHEADASGDGSLDLQEAVQLISTLCGEIGLAPPREEKVAKLIKMCDKTGDGELQLDEFEKFFGVVLRDAHKKAERDGLAEAGSKLAGVKEAEKVQEAAPEPTKKKKKGGN